MIWSLSEIEALARKAARGAGYDWGMAEDAGKCTRFLCAAGLPGAQALAGLLQRNDGQTYDSYRPECSGQTWHCASGLLCPVVTGTAICDRASMLSDGPITLGPTAFPLLLLPAIASAADMAEAGLTLRWPGLVMTRINRETWIENSGADLLTPEVAGITVSPTTAHTGLRVRRAYRADVPSHVTDSLGAFAHRTYAPDTPESRLSGAGAGLSDND